MRIAGEIERMHKWGNITNPSISSSIEEQDILHPGSAHYSRLFSTNDQIDLDSAVTDSECFTIYQKSNRDFFVRNNTGDKISLSLE